MAATFSFSNISAGGSCNFGAGDIMNATETSYGLHWDPRNSPLLLTPLHEGNIPNYLSNESSDNIAPQKQNVPGGEPGSVSMLFGAEGAADPVLFQDVEMQDIEHINDDVGVEPPALARRKFRQLEPETPPAHPTTLPASPVLIQTAMETNVELNSEGRFYRQLESDFEVILSNRLSPADDVIMSSSNDLYQADTQSTERHYNRRSEGGA
ncbi:hypothetical protein FA15DRAFT_674401 [Coprinopsis marcescibilis]|uniref:Uncharacterized protein n=1 Tax=Coprinopsis marcescibilis TaxID=230819 RepID=A0A5C3KHT7_COPMA|nr:hypothetical protein FA15DRAFT_674401 [Coprinopsis marcescibilis]